MFALLGALSAETLQVAAIFSLFSDRRSAETPITAFTTLQNSFNGLWEGGFGTKVRPLLRAFDSHFFEKSGGLSSLLAPSSWSLARACHKSLQKEGESVFWLL